MNRYKPYRSARTAPAAANAKNAAISIVGSGLAVPGSRVAVFVAVGAAVGFGSGFGFSGLVVVGTVPVVPTGAGVLVGGAGDGVRGGCSVVVAGGAGVVGVL